MGSHRQGVQEARARRLRVPARLLEGSLSGRAALSGGDPEDDAFILPITDEIDLHAFRPQDVLSVVEAYLDACSEKGLLDVRLVHGRGRGVQRAAIARLLRARADVIGFRDANPADGGWGATRVQLLARVEPTKREEK